MADLVRNARGVPVPCCYSDCTARADNRYRHEEPHEEPRWPGEKVVWTFCGPTHLDRFVSNNRTWTRTPLGLLLPPTAR